MDANSAPVTCGGLPMPAEAKCNLPGCALASAMNSFTVFAGTVGWMLSTLPYVTFVCVIVSKSLSES